MGKRRNPDLLRTVDTESTEKALWNQFRPRPNLPLFTYQPREDVVRRGRGSRGGRLSLLLG